MKLSYSVLYIAIIFALTGCTVLAKRSARPCRGAVARLETSLMLPIIGNLLILLSGNRLLTIIGYYIYFISIDLVLLALVSFTNAYCTGIGNGTQKPTVMYVGLSADMVQILLNLIFGHAFDVEQVAAQGESSFRLAARAGVTVHRIVDYIVLICVILIFTLASVITPKIYRERYTVLLAAMIAIGMMQAHYIFSRSPYDRTVIGYGVFGIILFYFAIYYRPLRLLDSMLSNIISDLSDAFYVFDANGKCVWANDQGCKLAEFSGRNYEEIGSKLIRMFGDPGEPGERVSKRTLGEGEDVHFYTLEEKQVRDSGGKPSGSYLRIRDVTAEEHEIQVRDEQIGQISQEAYRDALTGVGSKAAYNNKIAELNEQITDGSVEFAVVMIDLNQLKRINDEYGHKAGDLYIRGCCHLICEIFKHSPVFRIGGDEFVVILRGQDYAERIQHVENLRTAYEDAYEQEELDPWERYSASVGMAENAFDDNSFELVFRRADTAMYEEKKRFKVLHGTYR